MDAQTFYAKAVALNRMGTPALVTQDFQTLAAEMKAADRALRSDNDRAKAQGRALYCPPASNDMTADQLLAEFRRIPLERRKKMSVRQAWREIAVRRYPC